jgi:hypothetical protein
MNQKFLLFLKTFFTKVNFSKILVIFFVGFTSRFFIHYFFQVNVFSDFLHSFSIAYYFLFASFIVFINELFSAFNFSILPDFIYLYSNIPKFSTLWSSLRFFKFEYFKLSSIRDFIKYLNSRLYSYNTLTDDYKTLSNAQDTLEDSLVLKKSYKDPVSKGKGVATSEQGESSRSSNGRREPSTEERESRRSRGRKVAYTEEGESSRLPKGKGTASTEQGNPKLFNGQTSAYGSGWANGTSDFINSSHSESFNKKDSIRCACHWFFLERFNDKYSSYNDFKNKWDVESKYISELKRQVRTEFSEVNHKIKLAKRTVSWIFNPGKRK